MSELASLEQHGLEELSRCTEDSALRAWNTKYFGKQGQVTLAIKRVGEVPPAERRFYGQEANRVKESLTRAYEDVRYGRRSIDRPALHDLSAKREFVMEMLRRRERVR